MKQRVKAIIFLTNSRNKRGGRGIEVRGDRQHTPHRASR
jgi:hypothetical protein